ncbi:MAG: hypothetical protein J6J23_02940 [Clostridia bacterium]|nr:hypothetical protein [Clostridia bacterium]
MDWIKDITVDEVIKLFCVHNNSRVYYTDFRKINHPAYGTIFTFSTYVNEIDYEGLFKTYYLGNFGSVYGDRGAGVNSGAPIVNFNIGENGNIYETQEGNIWLNYVASKNIGFVDENGNDYFQAYANAYKEERENWYKEKIKKLAQIIENSDRSFNTMLANQMNAAGYVPNKSEQQS